MKVGNQIHLIADDTYRATSQGRDTWKTLIDSQASLQSTCSREGFNVLCDDIKYSKARIGIISDNDKGCPSCGPRIRFGTGGYPNDSNTCGKEASEHEPDNGETKINAMGVILVQ